MGGVTAVGCDGCCPYVGCGDGEWLESKCGIWDSGTPCGYHFPLVTGLGDIDGVSPNCPSAYMSVLVDRVVLIVPVPGFAVLIVPTTKA